MLSMVLEFAILEAHIIQLHWTTRVKARLFVYRPRCMALPVLWSGSVVDLKSIYLQISSLFCLKTLINKISKFLVKTWRGGWKPWCGLGPHLLLPLLSHTRDSLICVACIFWSALSDFANQIFLGKLLDLSS